MQFAILIIEITLASILPCFYGGKLRRSVPYSHQEEVFIIEQLENRADSYDGNTWKEIAEEHEKNVKANTPGFSTSRAPKSLQVHFITVILKKKGAELPEIVKELQENIKNVMYNSQETKFINAYLRSCPGSCLYGRDVWTELEKKFDERRDNGSPGFTTKRTWKSLCSHFTKVMMKKGLMDDDVKQRFQAYFEQERDFTCIEEGEKSDTSRIRNLECMRDEEKEVWGPILEDMLNLQRNPVDEFGIDHSLFQDTGTWKDGHFDLFMPNSPYEIRFFDEASSEDKLTSSA